MIVDAFIDKDKLTFRNSSTHDAQQLKGCILGTNLTMTVAPYGHRVDSKIIGTSLVLEKKPSAPFTYEEVLSIVNKVERFGKMQKEKAQKFLKDSRLDLESHLTLFFPTRETVRVEAVFSLNWFMLWFSQPQAQVVLDDIEPMFKNEGLTTIKGFAKGDDTISIHSYSMFGIYIERRLIHAICNILHKHSVLTANEAEFYRDKLYAHSIRCVAKMEYDNLKQNISYQGNPEEMPENASITDWLMSCLYQLSKMGMYYHIPAKQLAFLAAAEAQIADKTDLATKGLVLGTLHSIVNMSKRDIANALKNNPEAHGMVSNYNVEALVNQEMNKSLAGVDESGF